MTFEIYNLGNGAALRLDGDPPASPPSSDGPGCVISIQTSIRVRYVPIKVDGVRSTALRFTVPDELLEPITGVLNSVIGARFTITSKTWSCSHPRQAPEGELHPGTRGADWPAFAEGQEDGRRRGHARVRARHPRHRFHAGHRIRVQVSSGAHPRYARNPGTGEDPFRAVRLIAAEQEIFHDPERPSSVTCRC